MKKPLANLSRRERQIMDIIFQRGQATVHDVRADLTDPPSYSAVRALIRILEEKGHLKHKKEGAKYIYTPRQTQRTARQSALKHVVQTFFDNSVENTVAALMAFSGDKMSDEEYKRLTEVIEQARKGGAEK